MLAFKEWFVNKIKNDATMQGYLQDSDGNMNVYPSGVDLQPEQFPCVVYSEAGVSILSKPQGMHVGNFQADIMSINNELETENIHTRLAQLFNFVDTATDVTYNTGTLWWIREEMVRSLNETDRRLWRKSITYKVWFNDVGNT